MQLYRVLYPLSTGPQPYDIVQETDFREGVLAILAEKNIVSPVSTPPLHELPGWKLRAKMLAEVGIITIQDLVDAEEEVIKEAVRHKTNRAVETWKKEALEWLVSESNCGRC